jgi:hypothetical protein
VTSSGSGGRVVAFNRHRLWLCSACLSLLAIASGSNALGADPSVGNPAGGTATAKRMVRSTDIDEPMKRDDTGSMKSVEKMVPDTAASTTPKPSAEPAVPTPPRVAPLPPAREARIAATVAAIDAALERAWREAGVTPTAPAGDAEYFRRLSIDLIGRIPRVNEAREFLADPPEERRKLLVERLLATPEHARYMASIWHGHLVPDSQGTSALEPWLEEKFAADVPFDRVVSEIISAPLGNGGGTGGPAAFYRILGYKPEDVAAATSRTFLGTQIQCAQCHKHPYDNWTQEDFWGHAAFFAGFVPLEPGGQEGREDPARDIKHPKTGAVVRPRFLGGPDAEPRGDRRRQLAAWMTSARNPYFARATVNRTWGLMFGAGIIDPVDDMGGHNPPAQPEVLDELTRFFATGWSNRDLFRVLARTRAYGLASGAAGARKGGTRTFSAMMIKPLNATQLYNSLSVAYHSSRPAATITRGRIPDRQSFLDKFRAAPGQTGEYTFGIPQAITLMNSDMFDPLRVPYHSAVVAERFDAGRIEALFLITLSRLPTSAERERFGRFLAEQTAAVGRNLALVDIHWALINSAEFAFNH